MLQRNLSRERATAHTDLAAGEPGFARLIECTGGGVAILVALTALNATTGFDHAWIVQVGAGHLAATSLLALRSNRT